MIIKKLKNTTVSPLLHSNSGILFPVGQYVDVNDSDVRSMNDTQMSTFIANGDIIVNNGTYDLSASSGFKYLIIGTAIDVVFESDPERVNGFIAKNTQEAIEEARNSITSKLLNFVFSSTGVTFNKWLNVGHPSSTSDSTPYTSEWSGKAIGINFSNVKDNVDTNLKFYVNGTLKFTWSVTNKRTAWNVKSAGFFTVNQGDRISVYAEDASSNDPSSIFGEVLIEVQTMPDGEGGTDSGV